jgi:hypothetical protein
MAFKMKGSPMYRNFGIGASPVKKEGVTERKKLTPKEIAAHEARKENYKRIRAANPDDFELRKHGMPGEHAKGTWTHKKSGKIMKDYVAEGTTLPTVEVKGKKSPATKKENKKFADKKGQGAGDGSKKGSKGKDLDKMPGGMGGEKFTYLPPGTKKKSPATKKKKVDLNPAKIDYKNMTKAQVRAAVIAQNRKGPKTSISMSHAMRMHKMAQK